MDNITREKWSRVALWQTLGIGRVRYTQLLQKSVTASNLFRASEKELSDWLPIEVAKAVRKTFAHEDVQALQNKLEQYHISVLVQNIDATFPELLKNLPNSPPVLYVKGELVPEDKTALAVVGTRKPTRYGLEVTHMIAGELAMQGVTIVSGLAYGIDAQAHQAALDAGGRTIAVLAHGLDRVYPTGNEKLAEHISKQGALLSAFPPGEPPSRGHFVARDEWIAMLSQGVLVTEGAVGSGALITASAASKLGRAVFAVPGPITSAMNHAPTHLLKSGAKLVTSAQDILGELGLSSTHAKPEMHKKADLENPLQQDIYKKLQLEPQTGDELSRSLSIPIFEITSELTLMELAGIIEQDSDRWRIS